MPSDAEKFHSLEASSLLATARGIAIDFITILYVLLTAGLVGAMLELVEYFLGRSISRLRYWIVYFCVILIAFGVYRYVTEPRRLSKAQRTELTLSLDKNPDSFCCGFMVGYFRSCADCPDYAWDFAESINDIKRPPRYRCAPMPLDKGLNTRMRGVILAMLDSAHPSAAAQSIATALRAAHVKFVLGSFPDMRENIDPAADTILLIMPSSQ